MGEVGGFDWGEAGGTHQLGISGDSPCMNIFYAIEAARKFNIKVTGKCYAYGSATYRLSARINGSMVVQCWTSRE